MKLTYFSEQTLPKGSFGRAALPRMNFSKTGVISLNPAAVEQLKLTVKDRITLAQDPDTPENWYLFKDQNYGYQLRPGYKEVGLMFNHIALKKTIWKCFDLDEEKGESFRIAPQPTKIDKTEYWGILVTT